MGLEKQWGGPWGRGLEKNGSEGGPFLQGTVAVLFVWGWRQKKNNDSGAGRGCAFGAAWLLALRSTVAWGAAQHSSCQDWGERATMREQGWETVEKNVSYCSAGISAREAWLQWANPRGRPAVAADHAAHGGCLSPLHRSHGRNGVTWSKHGGMVGDRGNRPRDGEKKRRRARGLSTSGVNRGAGAPKTTSGDNNKWGVHATALVAANEGAPARDGGAGGGRLPMRQRQLQATGMQRGAASGRPL